MSFIDMIFEYFGIVSIQTVADLCNNTFRFVVGCAVLVAAGRLLVTLCGGMKRI